MAPIHKMTIIRLRTFYDVLRAGLHERTVGKKIYKMFKQQEKRVTMDRILPSAGELNTKTR